MNMFSTLIRIIHMFRIAVFGFGIIAVTILVWAGVLPDIASAVQDTRTVDVTDSAISCTTNVAETTCLIDLTEDHAFGDTRGMSIAQTIPSSVDRTDDSTLNAGDRDSLTIGSLSPSTGYNFDIDFKGTSPDISDFQSRVFNFIPWAFLFVFLYSSLLGLMAAFDQAKRTGRAF